MPGKEVSKISIYVVAHADDWQLFMQPNAFNDLVSTACKVVFIVTTAGDAGANETFWAAREEGMKSSIRFCLKPHEELRESTGTKVYNFHDVNYWSINNTTSYFLRLPDGGLEGNGFPINSYQSLSKFRAGSCSTISAIDNSTIYNSWSDFYKTLEAIILAESNGLTNISVNYLDPNVNANPNDHPDHLATGEALQLMPTISTVNQAKFVGYSVSNKQQKLSEKDLFWKAGMFAAYEKAVFDASGYSTLNEGVSIYLNWCLSSAKFVTINI